MGRYPVVWVFMALAAVLLVIDGVSICRALKAETVRAAGIRQKLWEHGHPLPEE
jgi:hypothetical protein